MTPTRQARSIARRRAEWRVAGLCPVCGAARARKTMKGTGEVKLLSKCAGCLERAAAWARAR